MAAQRFLNNFDWTFLGPVTASTHVGYETTIGVGILQISDAASALLTTLTGGDWYVLTGYKRVGSVESAIEIFKVLGVNEVAYAAPGECRIRVERAHEGSALQTYVAGDLISMRLTAGGLSDISANANLTGEATTAGNVVTLTNAAVIAKVLTGYVSGAGTVAATDTILQAINKLNGNDALKQTLANKDASGGYAGLTAFKVNLRNEANTFTSFLTNVATAARTWTMPNQSGTVAVTTDITGGTLAGAFATLTVTSGTSAVNVGTTAKAWGYLLPLQIGNGVYAGHQSNPTAAYSGANFWLNGAGVWKRIGVGEANLCEIAGGATTWRRAVTGVADSDITWVDSLSISAAGAATIPGTLEVTGIATLGGTIPGAATTQLTVVAGTAIPAAITASSRQLRLARLGTGGVKYSANAEFCLGSYGAALASQTQLDIRLGNGNTNDPDVTVMSLLGSGAVSIPGALTVGSGVFSNGLAVLAGALTATGTASTDEEIIIIPGSGSLGKGSIIRMQATFSSGWGGGDVGPRNATRIRTWNPGSGAWLGWAMDFDVNNNAGAGDSWGNAMRILQTGIGTGTVSTPFGFSVSTTTGKAIDTVQTLTGAAVPASGLGATPEIFFNQQTLNLSNFAPTDTTNQFRGFATRTNISGTHGGTGYINDLQYLRVASNTAVASGMFVAMVGQAVGGIAVTRSQNLYGGNFYGNVEAGCTGWSNVTGAEFNTECQANTVIKTGLQIVSQALDIGSPSTVDAAIAIGAVTPSGGTNGFSDGILFTEAFSSRPIKTSGTLIRTSGVRTVTNGIDFSSYTFSGYALVAAGLNIEGTGKLNTVASTTARTGLVIPHGAAPTTPSNGDVWTTTGGLYVRINGVTKTVTLT